MLGSVIGADLDRFDGEIQATLSDQQLNSTLLNVTNLLNKIKFFRLLFKSFSVFSEGKEAVLWDGRRRNITKSAGADHTYRPLPFLNLLIL